MSFLPHRDSCSRCSVVYLYVEISISDSEWSGHSEDLINALNEGPYAGATVPKLEGESNEPKNQETDKRIV